MYDLLTITGASCSGKTTLEAALCQHNSRFSRIVSVTTRPPRSGEQSSSAYVFVTDEEFDSMLNQNKLVEYVEFAGFKYGCRADDVLQAKAREQIPVLVCEPIGLRQILKWGPTNNMKVLSIFMNAPAYSQVVMQRFLERLQYMLHTGATQEAMLNRMDSFRHEMTHWWEKVDALFNARAVASGCRFYEVSDFSQTHLIEHHTQTIAKIALSDVWPVVDAWN